VFLAVSALALFVAGELLLLYRSDSGQVSMASHLGLVDRARVTQILSVAMKRALRSVGVAPAHIAESFPEGARAPVRWKLQLPSDASLVLTNYAVSQALRARGARVMEGREERLPDGSAQLVLLAGIPRYVTHELVITRLPQTENAPPQASLALVLFGFDPEDAEAVQALDAPVPFAVAALPGSRHFDQVMERAHERHREVVLSLPLEPINYPRIDPGPGAVLVTMKPLEVQRLVRKHMDDAGSAVAAANHMGSLATQDERIMRVVFAELRRERLPFVHVDPVPGQVCRQLSADEGVAYQMATVAMDREARGSDMKKLERAWGPVLEQARERGRMVMFLRATPLVRKWLPRIADPKRRAGVDLVPLSSVVPRPPAL
jgi:polysaccharide deacetylase 2 family uncharacterized protein YibQ